MPGAPTDKPLSADVAASASAAAKIESQDEDARLIALMGVTT